MVKHIWSVLCQSSVVDSQSNNVSLYNIVERLEVNINPNGSTTFPVVKNINLPWQYELVSLWSRTKKGGEENANIRIDLLDPNGKELKSFEKEIIIPADKKRMREINKIQGISLTESGDYTFVVSIKQANNSKYEKVASLPLEVMINQTPNLSSLPVIKS